MIKLTGIEKSYGNLKVLKGIDLEIPEGEVIAICGASGAGKSTLLHIIGTLDKPDKGEVLFDSTSIFALKDEELSLFRNQNIGFVFQFHHLLPEFTAVENVALPAMIAGESKKNAIKKAQDMLQIMQLSERFLHKPAQLSGGEQQRVAVARALINNPKVVLADEPSGNLDTEHAKNLHQLFFDLRDKFQKTFVIVTHNEELAKLSDRKIIIRDGKITM
ncbi:MAG: ABC transporter ATP-binding protein [Bacteroidetes bacterium]|nr:ABC transporter ATP-binding protein [Bacteroidota bacterium]MCL1968179.1 ABC transporter ATP-binding protein [Bacteroidota bacterium]MCL1968546.1 ABC transporter ATP-binding protein [Bacteroidota bacterium]